MSARLTRLKMVATLNAGQSPPSEKVTPFDGEGRPFLQGNAEFGASHPEARLACQDAPKVCRIGDVLVSVRAPVGALNIADRVYGIGRGLCAITAKSVDPRYLWWVLQSSGEYLASAATGSTYDAVSADDVGSLPVWVPMPEDQIRIAAFLDRETIQIDVIVAKRLLQMQLARARLQAAVDSEFSSFAPAWRLKHLISQPLQYGASEPAESEDATWPRYIRTTDFDDQGNLRDDTFRSLPPAVARPFLLQDGDLLLTRSGATVGKSLRWRYEWGVGCFAGYLIRARPDPAKVVPDYLAYYLRSSLFWDVVGMTTIQATIQNVSAERYGELRVPILPLDDQHRVVERLNLVAGETRAMGASLQRQVALLRERRQALITAAVTGQIEIPGVAA